MIGFIVSYKLSSRNEEPSEDKSKVITDKNGSRFFALIGLISVIISCVFYYKGFKDSIIVTLIFGFSIIIISLKNSNLISKNWFIFKNG